MGTPALIKMLGISDADLSRIAEVGRLVQKVPDDLEEIKTILEDIQEQLGEIVLRLSRLEGELIDD